jgi:hypothetical protein
MGALIRRKLSNHVEEIKNDPLVLPKRKEKVNWDPYVHYFSEQIGVE